MKQWESHVSSNHPELPLYSICYGEFQASIGIIKNPQTQQYNTHWSVVENNLFHGSYNIVYGGEIPESRASFSFSKALALEQAASMLTPAADKAIFALAMCVMEKLL